MTDSYIKQRCLKKRRLSTRQLTFQFALLTCLDNCSSSSKSVKIIVCLRHSSLRTSSYSILLISLARYKYTWACCWKCKKWTHIYWFWILISNRCAHLLLNQISERKWLKCVWWSWKTEIRNLNRYCVALYRWSRWNWGAKLKINILRCLNSRRVNIERTSISWKSRPCDPRYCGTYTVYDTAWRICTRIGSRISKVLCRIQARWLWVWCSRVLNIAQNISWWRNDLRSF